MKLDINERKKRTVNHRNIWKLNKPLLKNQAITEENKDEITKYQEKNDTENTTTPAYGMQQKQF